MDLTKEEFRDLLEKSEEKTKAEIKELLKDSIDANFQRFENALLKRDADVQAKINRNEREIDGAKRDVEQAMKRTDKLFGLSDKKSKKISELEKVVAEKCQEVEDIQAKCCERHTLMNDLSKSISEMKTKITYTQGFIACICVIAGIIKVFM